MNLSIVPFLVAAAVLLLSPSASLAATKADKLKACINEQLSQAESDALIIEITEWKHLFTESVKQDTVVCYGKLTGELAVFVQGEGLLFGPEALRVLDEEKRLAEELEAESKREAEETKRRAEVVAKQPKIREELKCALLEEWASRSIEKSAADAIIDADALFEEKRQAEAYLETYRACKDWYISDNTEALTSAVCSPLFLELGLPDTEISGPSREEILDASTTSLLASVHLDSLKTRLQRIEFDENYVAEYSEVALYERNKKLEGVRAPSDRAPLGRCGALWLHWKSEN